MMKKMNLMTFGKISILLIIFMFSIDVSADTVNVGKFNIKEITFSAEKQDNFINNLWYATKDLGNQEEILIGKNLLNVPSTLVVDFRTKFNISLYAGTYTLSASSITTSGANSSLFQFQDENGNYLYYQLSNSYLSHTFTTKTKLTLLSIFSQNDWGNSQNVTTTFTNLMLEKGDTATSYEAPKVQQYKKYVDYNVADYNDLVFKDFSVASKQNLSLRFKSSSSNYTYSLSGGTLKRGVSHPLYSTDVNFNQEYGTINEYYINDTHTSNPKLDRITDRTDVEFNSSIQDRDLIYTYAYYVSNSYFFQLTPKDTPIDKFEGFYGCDVLYNHYYDNNYMDKPKFIQDTAQCMTSMKTVGNLSNTGRDNIETFQDSMISISSNNKIYAKMKLYKDGSLVSTLVTSMITRYVPLQFEDSTTGEWRVRGWGIKFEVFAVYDDVEFDSIQTEIYLNGHLVTYKNNSEEVLSFVKWGDYKIISLSEGQSMRESLLSKTDQLKNFIIKIFKYIPILGDILAILIEIIFSLIDILIIIADMFASLPLWLYQGLGVILICIVAKIIKELVSSD